MSGSIRDITDRKQLEDLRRKSLEEANRLKSEFLANMSHELRTPLNGIIGFAEMMHDEKLGPVSASHKEYLGDILTSAQHLLQLINDVLDLAKVEAGKLEFQPEPVELSKVIRETCDIVRTMAAKKRLRIGTEVDPGVNSAFLDPAKLKQVLYNYLSNAIKFTPDGGRITVRTAPQGPHAFRLEVEDTGIGIKPEDLGRLFIEFQQLDSTTAKKYQGTGLGLALTKKIVEAQGGQVGVNSAPGKGSAFFAVLPRRLESRAGADEAEGSEWNMEGGSANAAPKPVAVKTGAPTILVVEDDAKERSWLAGIVAGAHYNVEVAATGAGALALCRERAFDGITLDLLLPDMSGWDLLKKIREDGLNRATPVIVATVVADKTAALGHRIEEFLIKPVAASDLIAAMQRTGILRDKPGKILCIDDDKRSLKLAETALRKGGYTPVCETDARAALKFLAKERPAAIVLDLMMPGMDGFEFLDRLRRMKNAGRIPIIVWTVKDVTRADRRRLQKSVQAIVAKGPSGTAQLVKELNANISRDESPADGNGAAKSGIDRR